jgi:hypothetical protein
MQTIGAFKLRNNGGFVCAPAAKYIDADGNFQQSSNGGNIALGQGEMFSPGDHGVPDGCVMQMYIWIEAGSDRTGQPFFVYDSSSNMYAEYDITGTTLQSDVHFDGVKSN